MKTNSDSTRSSQTNNRQKGSGAEQQTERLASHHEVRAADKLPQFQVLKQPSAGSDRRTALALGSNILVAVAAVAMVWLAPAGVWKSLALVLATVLTAAQQCAVGNWAHMGIHGKLFSNPTLNYVATRLLSALMFYSFKLFQAIHNHTHHAHLGGANDLERVLRRPPLRHSMGRAEVAWTLVRTFVFDGQAWKTTVFGDLPTMVELEKPVDALKGINQAVLLKDLLVCALVWAFVLGLCYAIGSGTLVLTMLAVWLGTKMTVYHLIRVGRELFDHYGMPKQPDSNTDNHSVLAYTRTMPLTFLTYWFNGFGDRFHTIHHMWASIPMVNLAKAHKLLMTYSPTYRNGVKQYDGYFFGKKTVLQSMIDGVLNNHV